MTTLAPEIASATRAQFWRQRLARVLLVGGIALIALRFAPNMPQEHPIEFVAPSGVDIAAIDLLWRRVSEAAPLGGVQLKPQTPTGRVFHPVKAPQGRYTLEITAQLVPACTDTPCEQTSEQERTVWLERTVDLQGDRMRLPLTEH